LSNLESRQTYYPIVFLDPMNDEKQRNLMGLDIAVNPGFSEAPLKAIDTGQPAMSKTFKRISGGRGYVLFKASYRTPQPPLTVDDRHREVHRVASLLVHGESLMGPNELPSAVDVRLYDASYSRKDIDGQLFRVETEPIDAQVDGRRVMCNIPLDLLHKCFGDGDSPINLVTLNRPALETAVRNVIAVFVPLARPGAWLIVTGM
jgi:hypothetical protein